MKSMRSLFGLVLMFTLFSGSLALAAPDPDPVIAVEERIKNRNKEIADLNVEIGGLQGQIDVLKEQTPLTRATKKKIKALQAEIDEDNVQIGKLQAANARDQVRISNIVEESRLLTDAEDAPLTKVDGVVGLGLAKAKCTKIKAAEKFLHDTDVPKTPFNGLGKWFEGKLYAQRVRVQKAIHSAVEPQYVCENILSQAMKKVGLRNEGTVTD